MADGLSTVNFANKLLNTVNGTSFSVSGTYVQLHVGAPGSAGTAATSAVTTRQSTAFATASGGSLGLSAPPTAWNMTVSETISDISVWDAVSGGNFLWSAQLAVAKAVANGDTLTLNTCTLSLAPLAS
jgi:hypothetical protein